MSERELEEIKKELLLATLAKNKVRLMWQILTAIGCTFSLIFSFTWTGKGFVDDLKYTVTDNAKFANRKMDSLFLSHEYRFVTDEKEVQDVKKTIESIYGRILTDNKTNSHEHTH